MGVYKRILAPVDCSASSLNALREAARFAKRDRAELLALHVIPPYAGDVEFVIGGVMEEMEDTCKKAVDQVSEIATEEGVVVKTIVEEGEPAEMILQAAEERGCDLVVMGRRGLRRLEYVLVGSATRHLVDRGRMEVLVMPLGSAIGLQSLLLALDAVPRSPAAVERAIQLAKVSGGKLHVVLARDPAVKTEGESPATVEAIKRKAEARGVHAKGLLREGKLHEVIARMVRETSSGFLVIGKRVKTGLEPLFPKGELEKILSHSQVPVLVVP